MAADSVHGARDKGDDGRLNAQKRRSCGYSLHDTRREIQPGQREHQHEAGQHESQACKKTAELSFGKRAEEDAQLVGFRTGEHLIYREDAVEPGA